MPICLDERYVEPLKVRRECSGRCRPAGAAADDSDLRLRTAEDGRREKQPGGCQSDFYELPSAPRRTVFQALASKAYSHAACPFSIIPDRHQTWFAPNLRIFSATFWKSLATFFCDQVPA